MTLSSMHTAALRRFLIDSGVSVSGALVVEPISGGRSNLTFRAHDDVSTWVVRRPPTSGLTPSAHDMAREYTVTQALGSTTVPVASAVAFDAAGRTLGAPMTVVEYVHGRVIRSQDDLASLSDAQIPTMIAALVSALADLHRVNFSAVGLQSFGRPDGFLARQVAVWTRQWERVKTRELTDMAALSTALAAGVPGSPPAAIVHGDFRVDNVILDHERPDIVRAIVDWEMATLGDPLTDIALMCVYRSPAFDLVLGADAAWTSPRLPTPDALAQLYALESGRDLQHWDFYLALANFKLAVIAEGIAHRAHSGPDAGRDALSASAATPEFLAAGLRTLSAR